MYRTTMKSLPVTAFSAVTLILGVVLSNANTDALAQTSNISNTRHNLSSTSTNTVQGATGELCVFCHTPHSAVANATAPLWNRSPSPVGTYTTYFSSTLDAVTTLGAALPQPGAESKLCLSCHDGTLAPGSGLSNSPGSTVGTITMTGGTACDAPGSITDTNCIPLGTEGKTRRLGTDLSNDHPISQTYDSTLATNDGELRPTPYTNTVPVVAIRTATVRPKLPLNPSGTVQCNTCHDPHVSWPARNVEGVTRDPGKFLRLPRFQQTDRATSTHTLAKDQVCVSCHDKKGWVGSIHAGNGTTAAAETYTDAAADAREFPRGTTVWEAGCLNCHDTHGRTGTRKLLRNGLDATPNPAVEEVCYQCHQVNTSSAVNTLATLTATAGVPNIKTEFTGTNKIRMPITDADQRGSGEAHEIINADFLECRKKLGSTTSVTSTGLMTPSVGGNDEVNYCNTLVTTGTNDRRHAECSDCHNPHRVLKNKLFNSGITGADATVRTHRPGTTTAGQANGSLNNLASGPLAGIWGVDPTVDAAYGTTWGTNPTAFTVKFGQPGTATDVAQAYLTREYQLCFKCHSNFAYEDNGQYGNPAFTSAAGTAGVLTTTADTRGVASGRPLLGATSGSGGGTAALSNYVMAYTNQAAEFQVRANAGVTGTDQGASGANAKRSWHPVTYPTGRTIALRGNFTPNSWQVPFQNVGTQTMYCSDCHGAEASWTIGGASGGPNPTKVQGPHGSTNNFLLRGTWNDTVRHTTTGALCFNCHNVTYYGGADSVGGTGFCCDQKNNHHGYHGSSKAQNVFYCTVCHIAVPHGWKNKAFLVNLGGYGTSNGKPSTEAGFASETTITASGTTRYYNPPYYLGAKLRVNTWAASGAWSEGSCFNGKSGMQSQCGQ